jgi:hypothetical protein
VRASPPTTTSADTPKPPQNDARGRRFLLAAAAAAAAPAPDDDRLGRPILLFCLKSTAKWRAGALVEQQAQSQIAEAGTGTQMTGRRRGRRLPPLLVSAGLAVRGSIKRSIDRSAQPNRCSARVRSSPGLCDWVRWWWRVERGVEGKRAFDRSKAIINASTHTARRAAAFSAGRSTWSQPPQTQKVPARAQHPFFLIE